MSWFFINFAVGKLYKKISPIPFYFMGWGASTIKIRIMYRMCDSGGTQTRDTQFRKLMLYSPELRNPFEYPFYDRISIFSIR